jgi:hypothetical protein
LLCKKLKSEQDVEKTWKPTTAGILCIIAGAIGVIAGIVVATIGGIIATFFGIAWTGAFGVPSIILGIIAIIGGIYALRRRVWGLALAGSICAHWSLGDSRATRHYICQLGKGRI